MNAVVVPEQHGGSGSNGHQEVGSLARAFSLSLEQRAGPQVPGVELVDRNGVEAEVTGESVCSSPRQAHAAGSESLNFAGRSFDGVRGDMLELEGAVTATAGELGQCRPDVYAHREPVLGGGLAE